jgi:toxin-antitoxin system PIN domain toxin
MDLPDCNVLLYAVNTASPFHAQAAKWLDALLNGDVTFAVSDLVLQAVVRISTLPRVFPRPLMIDEALAFVESVRGSHVARPVTAGPAHWNIFSAFCRSLRLSGNDITDAYHAALAVEHGCEFLTFDSGFSRFPGLKWRKPF